MENVIVILYYYYIRFRRQRGGHRDLTDLYNFSRQHSPSSCRYILYMLL